jgi:hypothetical protein
MRTVLPAEVRHALIYLQQHHQRNVSRLIVVGSAIPNDTVQDLGRAVGLDVSSFGAEDLIVPPKASADAPAAEWSLLAASLPLVGASPPAVNLARTHVASRQSAKALGVASWIVGLALLAGVFEWGLDLDMAEKRATVNVSELERSVAELKTIPVPEDDWRVTEVKAINRLVEQADLESPPWAEVLHELGHITPPSVRFETLTLSQGRVQPEAPKPGARSSRRKNPSKARAASVASRTSNGAETASKEWTLAVSGTVSGKSVPEIQVTFRAWYEDVVVSPYLARVDIDAAEIGKPQAASGRGASAAAERRRAALQAVPAGTAEPDEPDSVLHFRVHAELATADAVGRLVADLDESPGGEP